MEPKHLRRTTLAEVVRGEVARQKKTITRAQLAKAADISTDTLRARLKGDSPFNVDEFVALCHALRVPVAEMFDRAGIK